MNKKTPKTIDDLATFILENVPGEPSSSVGTVECAIRIMTKQQAKLKGQGAARR